MSLPSGYKRLEYIQSSGTQYINTGITPDSTTSLSVEFRTASSKCVIAGCDSGWKSKGFAIGATASEYGNASKNVSVNDGKRHVAQIYNGSFIVDGEDKGSFSGSLAAADYPIYLCCNNRSGAASEFMDGEFYGCKISSGDAVIRDFVPCKNSTGQIGLWDDVDGVFYANSGTGVFVEGPAAVGTHKSLVDGTSYDMKSGKCLVDGTGYTIKKGRTLIDGTGYAIKLLDTVTVQLTGEVVVYASEKSSTVMIGGTEYEQNGAYEIERGTEILCKVVFSTNSRITVNGVAVSGFNYSFLATSDCTINRSWSMNGMAINGSIAITME